MSASNVITTTYTTYTTYSYDEGPQTCIVGQSGWVDVPVDENGNWEEENIVKKPNPRIPSPRIVEARRHGKPNTKQLRWLALLHNNHSRKG